MKEFRSRRLRVWENISRTMQEFKVILLGYRSYTALLTQTGTDAPVATVLENTIGDIVWSRDTIGEYSGTLQGAFPNANKVFQIIGTLASQTTFTQFFRNNNDSMVLATFDTLGNTIDSDLYNTPIEIRVYN